MAPRCFFLCLIFIDPSANVFSPAPKNSRVANWRCSVYWLRAVRTKRSPALEIGDQTVKTHVANVLGKLHADNRAQAVTQALKRGLIGLEELE